MKNQELFIFNPTCEMEIANGEFSWQPNKTLRQFERDLQYLPLLFAKKGDILVVHNEPSPIFQNWMNVIDIPEVYYVPEKNLLSPEVANIYKPGKLSPWGWSPAIHHKLQYLKPGTAEQFQNSPSSNWEKWHKNHYSRSTSLQILKDITSTHKEADLLPESLHPQVVKTVEGVKNCFNQWSQIVLKSPWSSSGRGVQMLRYGELNKSNVQWINSILKQQGYIMVEPLLEKLTDLSMHFHISPESIQYLGFGKFTTNKNGQYQNNIIRPQKNERDFPIPLKKLYVWLINSFESLNIQQKYEGYAGVDLMGLKLGNKTIVHPCVEVNWRFNMGLVALQLEKFIHPEAHGKFSVFFEPGSDFKSFHKKMTKACPLQKKNQLPFKGYFPLSDPEKAKSGAYVHLI